jgi:ribose-phosphate pyrophosphokinase
MEKRLVVSCSGGKHIAKDIAKAMGAQYSELIMEKFPDSEMDLKFSKEVCGRKVFLVQSFYGDISEKIIESLFAAYTARDLKAKKVNLIALHFPYLRKDTRFKPRQCVSASVMSKLSKVFNQVFIVDPHLHRISNLKKVIKNGVKLTSIPVISKYMKNKGAKNMVFIGPDSESMQWEKQASEASGCGYFIMEKTRYGSRNVKIKTKKLDLSGLTAVILDDIASSGYTLLEAVKLVKQFNPKKIYCIVVHGIYTDKNVFDKLRKEAVVLSTNTIPSKVAKINIAEIFKEIK